MWTHSYVKFGSVLFYCLGKIYEALQTLSSQLKYIRGNDKLLAQELWQKELSTKSQKEL